jgi:hypothetical protein
VFRKAATGEILITIGPERSNEEFSRRVASGCAGSRYLNFQCPGPYSVRMCCVNLETSSRHSVPPRPNYNVPTPSVTLPNLNVALQFVTCSSTKHVGDQQTSFFYTQHWMAALPILLVAVWTRFLSYPLAAGLGCSFLRYPLRCPRLNCTLRDSKNNVSPSLQVPSSRQARLKKKAGTTPILVAILHSWAIVLVLVALATG